MKNSFPTLWRAQQKGFIALPILIIAILGTMVLGGGSYAVYKVNQVQQESELRVADLEKKFEEVNNQSTTTEIALDIMASTSDIIASTTIDTVVSENKPPVSVSNSAPVTQPVIGTNTPIDVCSNITGQQMTVPDGYSVSGSTCIQKEDKCYNIEGIQDVVPAGMLVFKGYGCMIEREMDKISEASREAEKLSQNCSDLKTEVYEMDQQILDIEEKYRLKKSAVTSSPGQTLTQANTTLKGLDSSMYAEIAPIEIERNKKANEYNYLCVQ